MSSDASHDRLIGTVSLILDRMVHVRLTAVGLSRPELIDRTPVGSSRVLGAKPRPRSTLDPGQPRVGVARRPDDGASSSSRATAKGPGGTGAAATWSRPPTSGGSLDPRRSCCSCTAMRCRRRRYDRWLAKQMRLRGAHTARLDLPLHLRRTLPGQRSGDGYFSLDPAHIRAVVRQIGRGRRGGDRLGSRRGQPAS